MLGQQDAPAPQFFVFKDLLTDAECCLSNLERPRLEINRLL